MQADEKLNLCSIFTRYSFLFCKSRPASMKPGIIVEVHLNDPETIEDLPIVLDRSGEKIVARVQHIDRTCFWVEKGDWPPNRKVCTNTNQAVGLKDARKANAMAAS